MQNTMNKTPKIEQPEYQAQARSESDSLVCYMNKVGELTKRIKDLEFDMHTIHDLTLGEPDGHELSHLETIGCISEKALKFQTNT